MAGHDLVLHVGLPRSESVLAPALLTLRPQLRAHGVAFVSGAELQQLPHARGWDGSDWPAGSSDRVAFSGELAARVAAERHAAAERSGDAQARVVISGNRLLGAGDLGLRDARRLRPRAAEAMSQVIEALSARAVQVVLYTHRQDRLMELAQLGRLVAGQDAAITDYFASPFDPVLDYRELIGRLRDVPHVTDIVVRPVELADAGTQAFVNDFLDIIGVIGLAGGLDLDTIGPEVAPFYSPRGMQLAMAMNPLMETVDQLAALREFLTANYPAGEFGTLDLWDRTTRERIMDAYDRPNRQLFRQYMADLPEDSYSDDTATFELGNVLRQPMRRPRSAVPIRTPGAPSRRTVTTLARTARRRAASALGRHWTDRRRS